MDESIRHNKMLYEMSEANNRADEERNRKDKKFARKKKKMLALEGETLHTNGA